MLDMVADVAHLQVSTDSHGCLHIRHYQRAILGQFLTRSTPFTLSYCHAMVGMHRFYHSHMKVEMGAYPSLVVFAKLVYPIAGKSWCIDIEVGSFAFPLRAWCLRWLLLVYPILTSLSSLSQRSTYRLQSTASIRFLCTVLVVAVYICTYRKCSAPRNVREPRWYCSGCFWQHGTVTAQRLEKP